MKAAVLCRFFRPILQFAGCDLGRRAGLRLYRRSAAACAKDELHGNCRARQAIQLAAAGLRHSRGPLSPERKNRTHLHRSAWKSDLIQIQSILMFRLIRPSLRRACRLVVVLVFVLLAFQLATAASLEDALIEKPVIGKNIEGHLEVFRVDEDHQLRHRWQKQSNGDWSAWSSLGGSFLPGIATANTVDGQMIVFAVDGANHHLMSIRQEKSDGPDWSDWSDLGGEVQPPLAAAQNQDGRLEIFAVDSASGAAKHIWQTNTHGGWSEWADAGGRLDPGLAVARNRDGRLELFGIDSATRSLVHRWQVTPNAKAWSEWANLGGSIWPGFAIAQNAPGRMEVFAVSRTNNTAVRICQEKPGDAGWTGWENFGATLKPGVAAQLTADRLEVIAVNAKDGELLHRWETMGDGSDQWSGWKEMGAKSQPYPAMAPNEDVDLEVFAVDLENPKILNHKRQISHASGWLDWSSLDHATFQYSSRTWQVDEGLPHNLVQAIAQTRDGYLWIGTHEGLARFDGSSFTRFEEKSTPDLRNSSITALCADRDGALWIGTDGAGLAILVGGSVFRHDKVDGLAGDNVRVIYESRDGAMWIGTTTGMSRYQNGEFTNFTKKQGLLSDIVTSIYEDTDGNIWIATGSGLNCLKGKAMDSFAMPNGLPNDSVRGICQDRGGRIWIGSNNGMLWHNDYWTRSFFAYNTKYGLSDTFVSAICEDREGNLWVGTYSGLNRFREGRFFNELNNEDKPYDRVNTLFEDREGNLWVGSREGLTRLTPKRFFTYTKRQGLTHNNIMSVLEDRAGSLWLGTWGGGLNRLKDDRVTAYASTNDFSQGLLLALCEGGDGSIWIGADYDGGLTQMKDGKFKHYTSKEGLPKAPIKVIREDSKGRLWIGTSRGLSCFKDGRFTNYTAKNHLAGDVVHAICEDHNGNLWFGTDDGLSRWIDGAFTNLTSSEGLSDNSINALYEDREHDLWVGTTRGGLNRYKAGVFKSYTSRDGLFSDEIFEVLEDDQGWLWMTCSKGVFRVRKSDFDDFDQRKIRALTSIEYGKADGIESPQCNSAAKPGAWKSHDGRLWFTTSKGLITVDPKTIKMDQLPPPVYVEQVSADRKPLLGADALNRNRVGRAPNSISDDPDYLQIRVPPGRGELEFIFTALNFRAPERCHLKYRLDGVDQDWIDAGVRRTAHYNNIYPGTYRFHVVASNKDGVWNETGASVDVLLLPHIWQTWWFRGLSGILILGLAGGTGRYVTKKRMRRRLELLEQRQAIEKERRRIARDMHDQLGAGLTQVGLLGELARRDADKPDRAKIHASRICDLAREQAQTLDEIVWTIEPKNDLLNKLAAYIAVYAEQFFKAAGICCRLDIPPGLPAQPLSAELRHNLFLAVKEGLNNIAKHAGASEVHIRVSLNDSKLEIGLVDNGAGFVVRDIDSLGNGLSNMKHRIEEIGGTFTLDSEPAKGTRLQFQVPLKSNGADNGH